jgi:hypothetical protein
MRRSKSHPASLSKHSYALTPLESTRLVTARQVKLTLRDKILLKGRFMQVMLWDKVVHKNRLIQVMDWILAEQCLKACGLLLQMPC